MTDIRSALRERPGTSMPAGVPGAIVLFLACLAGLSACNTIEGAGEDVEATGEAIEEAAEDA